MRAVAPRWMPVVRDYELPVREVDPEFALMLYVSNWYRNAAAAAALSFWVFLPIGVVLGATGATETDWVAWVVRPRWPNRDGAGVAARSAVPQRRVSSCSSQGSTGSTRLGDDALTLAGGQKAAIDGIGTDAPMGHP